MRFAIRDDDKCQVVNNMPVAVGLINGNVKWKFKSVNQHWLFDNKETQAICTTNIVHKL